MTSPATRFLCLLMTLLAPAAALAQVTPSLFLTIGPGDPEPGPGLLSSHVVEVDAAIIRAAPVLLVNAPGYLRVAVRTALELRDDGFRWTGRIDSGNEVVITAQQGRLHAWFGGVDGRWHVRPQGAALRLSEVDTSFKFPRDQIIEPPVAPADPDRPPPLAKGGAGTAAAGVVHIDFWILYTAAARDGAGGEAEIRAFAQHLIDISNQALANSGVDEVRYRLRRASMADIPDGLSANDTLLSLRGLAGLSHLRTAYGADAVVLLAENFSDWSAGIAYIQRAPGPAFAENALAVVSRHWTLSSPVFTHETGHLLGMEHDPETAGLPPGASAFPWAHGHRSPVGEDPPPDPGFHTIMAYHHINCGTPCSSVLYFSNPDIEIDLAGTPTPLGVGGERDNARVAREVAAINAAFREETDALLVGGFDYRL